ncbi:hypothetical protein [Nocardia aurea]|uniref:hypothetical protein n=1 Tax=Nocardia aurea TaxID=2144174 RepID=UPI001300840D|nr:hypothetical protein [Nocardia aurea]
MTIHRPGVLEDLPAAETLWARWALLAAVDAHAADESKAGHRTGIWLDAEGLHLDDCGCTWWTMSRMGDGRFVLYGEDEASGVKFHQPRIDMVAGAPDWLPFEELRDRLEGHELGCVYWYDSGVWARASYPDDLRDDGLDCGMSRFVDRASVLGELRLYLIEGDHAPSAHHVLSDAEAYRLDVRVLLDSLRAVRPTDEPTDPDAVARVLAAAGVATPTT